MPHDLSPSPALSCYQWEWQVLWHSPFWVSFQCKLVVLPTHLQYCHSVHSEEMMQLSQIFNIEFLGKRMLKFCKTCFTFRSHYNVCLLLLLMPNIKHCARATNMPSLVAPQPHRKQSMLRCLKRLTIENNETRKQLCQAKKNPCSSSDVPDLAWKFYRLVRLQSAEK